MRSKLHIGKDLDLPLEATTQAIGIVAKRRVGKSYTARRIAEQLLHAGQQVVITDPKGDWWGIRSSADGKSPGFPVVILGGEHGDVPLEVGAGEVVAKMVVEERVSVLLDLSQFRKREVAVFMADFLETLYRLKAKESLRTPLMLIVDEADAIMPQKPNPGEERMLGAGEDIVRRGGQRGIGCMMISQRTAVLNKNVLTQCEMLVALRTISPQDLKAMQAWIDVHGEEGERDTLMQSLPSLPQGDAWFWSPGWPTSDGIFQRVHVLPIETFDSGATPKSGEKRIEPKRLADIDLPALTRQMAATIERARADDPKELRKEILSLRAQLAKAPVAKVAAGRTTAGADRAQIRRLTTALDAAMKFIVKITAADFDVAGVNKEDLEKAVTAAVDRASALIDQRLALRAKQIDVLRLEAERIGIRCKGLLEGLDADVTVAVDVARQPPFSLQPHRGPNGAAPARRETPRRSTVAAEGVTGVEQRILNTLLALEEMGVSPVDKPTAAALVGYHPNAKSYANALGSLNSGGRVRYPSGGQVELTDEGRAIARSELAIASVADLHATWFDRLGNVARKILEPLIESYPNARTADDVAQHAGYHPNAKSFANTKGRLRTLGLIDYPRSGEIVATRVLFPEGLT